MSRVLKRIKFFFSVSALYALTLFFAFSAFDISLLNGSASSAKAQKAPSPVAAQPEIKVVAAKPVKIIIPALKMDLPISDGDYNPVKKTWTLSDNHVHYAVPSMAPNDAQGNTLIYGHKYGWVFGPLKRLKPGDHMQLVGDTGKVFTYVYENTLPLKPEDNSVFRYEGQPSVSLQTCSGRFNEIRQIYNFKFVSVT